MQAMASYKGRPFANEAAGLVSEYVYRKRLAKLGFTSDIGKLSAWKAEAFVIIDTELDECQRRDMMNKVAKKSG